MGVRSVTRLALPCGVRMRARLRSRLRAKPYARQASLAPSRRPRAWTALTVRACGPMIPPLRPHRLEAQDTGFSSREQGFESPWGRSALNTRAAVRRSAQPPPSQVPPPGLGRIHRRQSDPPANHAAGGPDLFRLLLRTQPRSLHSQQPTVYHPSWITSFANRPLPGRPLVGRAPGRVPSASRHRQTRRRGPLLRSRRVSPPPRAPGHV